MEMEYLQEAERNKTLLTEVCKGLGRLPPDDPSVTRLKKDLGDRLQQLRTALSSLYELRSRDKTGSNPTLQSNYQIHLGDIEAVGTYCTTQLVQDLERLRDSLDDTEAAYIVDDVIRDLAEHPRAADLPQSRRQEVAKSLSGNRDAYRSARGSEEEPRESAVVVSPALLERLLFYQKQLGEYIQGLFICQRFTTEVVEVYSEFDNAQKRGLTSDDWNRVRKFVSEIFAAVAGLGSFFAEDKDLKASLTSLQEVVQKAREQLRAAGATNQTTEGLARHLSNMRDPLDDITTLCPNRANATLADLRDVINQILGQMDRQRGARYHSSERSVEVEDMTKIWRKPRSTSDSTVGRER